MSIAASSESPRIRTSNIRIGKPDARDGARVHALIARCPPLDRNSVYCNLLQCTHFAETSALARIDGIPRGFVSAYLPPQHPGVLFIWQVAVDHQARGCGLARRLITHILARDTCRDIQTLHTTVTRSNGPSRAMFAALARDLAAPLETKPKFDRHLHLAGGNESEELIIIGPFHRDSRDHIDRAKETITNDV